VREESEGHVGAPAGVETVPGVDEVAALRERLDAAASRPPAEQAEVFDSVHSDLRARLSAIDEV